ncbi:MAG TPA: LysM domain-containing protein, partial [Symbiobacteriaceae bacterium]|nr:LysM domain-containing protein [Symbiobacteriaceae bacterium]
FSGRDAQKAPEIADQGTLTPGRTTDTSSTDPEDEEATPASGTPANPVTGGTETGGTEPSATETGATVPEFHMVQANETLRDIAKKYYNDPNQSAAIEKLNKLDNPDLIKVGDKLELPKPDDTQSKAQPTQKDQTEQPSDEIRLVPTTP